MILDDACSFILRCDNCGEFERLQNYPLKIPENWGVDTEDRPYEGHHHDSHYCSKCRQGLF